MFLHAGRHLNRGLKLLINHGEKTPESLERLVEEMHDDKELCCYQLLNHPGSEDILWGIIRLLANKDSSVAGNAAYVVGTLCDMEVGRRRVLEIVVAYKDEGYDVLSNLTRILYCCDKESIMNASGTIGTLAETIEGRSWMLRKETLDETLTRITALLGNDDVWTASNAALIIARLTIEEEGCARILNRRDTRKLLVQLVNCLGTDDAGRGMNAAFAIGRLCDMESGRRHMLMLKKADQMLRKLTEMLHSEDGGCNKNACFALSCIAGSSDGVSKLLGHETREDMLRGLAVLLSTEDDETAWFAAMTLRTISSKKQGCLSLRDHKIVKDALKERTKAIGLKDDIKEEITVTLEILKHLGKPERPIVKIESASTANVQWVAVNPKSGLEVTYTLYIVTKEEKIAYSGLDTSFELQGLKPTKTYSCRLQTSTEGDRSPISEAATFTMPESVPSAPQNARVLGRTTTQLKLGWSPPESPNGLVTGYHIYQQGRSGFTETRETSHVFINLIPGTEYAFEVYALTSAGRGEKADIMCATVDLREHAPPRPTLHSLGRNEILVQWNPPEEPLGRINYYEVKQDGEVIYTGMERNCTSRRLKPNTEYSFTVAAWTNEGKCESEPAKKKTAKEINNFPREPLYPFNKRSKSGKAKPERASTASGKQANTQKQRSKSVAYSRPQKMFFEPETRPKTSFQTNKSQQPKKRASLAYSTGQAAPHQDILREVPRQEARRRHFSTGSAQNGEKRRSPSLQHSSDRPSVISFPSPVSKDSLIGLSFRPGSYSSIRKQPLGKAYSDTPNGLGGRKASHQKVGKTVSFETPFSKALVDLQAIHLTEKTSNFGFQDGVMRGSLHSPSSSLQTGRTSSNQFE